MRAYRLFCSFLFSVVLLLFKLCIHSIVLIQSAGDEWYLCRLTVTLPGMSDLQWAMSPEPYLATVEPGAAPAMVVYKLLARQKDGSFEVAQFLLVDGECGLHLAHTFVSSLRNSQFSQVAN